MDSPAPADELHIFRPSGLTPLECPSGSLHTLSRVPSHLYSAPSGSPHALRVPQRISSYLGIAPSHLYSDNSDL